VGSILKRNPPIPPLLKGSCEKFGICPLTLPSPARGEGLGGGDLWDYFTPSGARGDFVWEFLNRNERSSNVTLFKPFTIYQDSVRLILRGDDDSTDWVILELKDGLLWIHA